MNCQTCTRALLEIRGVPTACIYSISGSRAAGASSAITTVQLVLLWCVTSAGEASVTITQSHSQLKKPLNFAKCS